MASAPMGGRCSGAASFSARRQCARWPTRAGDPTRPRPASVARLPGCRWADPWSENRKVDSLIGGAPVFGWLLTAPIPEPHHPPVYAPSPGPNYDSAMRANRRILSGETPECVEYGQCSHTRSIPEHLDVRGPELNLGLAKPSGLALSPESDGTNGSMLPLRSIPRRESSPIGTTGGQHGASNALPPDAHQDRQGSDRGLQRQGLGAGQGKPHAGFRLRRGSHEQEGEGDR